MALIPGKWYKLERFNTSFRKYIMNDIYNYSEAIVKGKHSYSIGHFATLSNTLATQEELDKFLPLNHPDRIPEIVSNNEHLTNLLLKANIK